MNEENTGDTVEGQKAVEAIEKAADLVDQTDLGGKVLGDDKSMRAAIGALQAQTRALSEALEKVANVIRAQGYDL
jgi:hypothetical protein